MEGNSTAKSKATFQDEKRMPGSLQIGRFVCLSLVLREWPLTFSDHINYQWTCETRFPRTNILIQTWKNSWLITSLSKPWWPMGHSNLFATTGYSISMPNTSFMIYSTDRRWVWPLKAHSGSHEIYQNFSFRRKKHRKNVRTVISTIAARYVFGELRLVG